MYHVKEIATAPPGGLDMNIADEEEFSPDKLRSNIERLYMTIVSLETQISNRYLSVYRVSVYSLSSNISFDCARGVNSTAHRTSAQPTLWLGFST